MLNFNEDKNKLFDFIKELNSYNFEGVKKDNPYTDAFLKDEEKLNNLYEIIHNINQNTNITNLINENNFKSNLFNETKSSTNSVFEDILNQKFSFFENKYFESSKNKNYFEENNLFKNNSYQNKIENFIQNAGQKFQNEINKGVFPEKITNENKSSPVIQNINNSYNNTFNISHNIPSEDSYEEYAIRLAKDIQEASENRTVADYY